MSNQESQESKRKETVWRLIAKSLGEKSGKNNKEADKIALIRLFMFLSIFITNCFIIGNAIRHWNDNECDYLKSINKTQKLTGPLKVHQ